MKIGEKIKKFRTEKSMTQSELAGSFITRNMLSLIESGSAQPSLPTVEYIAKRLNVPLGILVSDDDGEYFYRRMQAMENIHRTFESKNYRICLSLCESMADSRVKDNELNLIRAECLLEIAKEEFSSGHLKIACDMFDRAVEMAHCSNYNTLHIEAEATVYCNYMKELSPTLYSENIENTEAPTGLAGGDDFCRYLSALKDVENCQNSFKNGIYSLLINIKSLLSEKKHAEAMQAIFELLNGSENISVPIMYDLFCELEICCREVGDFKGAYEYSGAKVIMLEKLLSEEFTDD